MALNFPSNPVDGQLYPDPYIPGTQQFVYNSSKGTWLTVFRGIERVTADQPLFISGPSSEPQVNIRPASDVSAGSMSSADKIKLDSLTPAAGTVTSVTAGAGLGAPQTGTSIISAGTIKLLPAALNSIGGIIPGSGVNVATDGTLTLAPPTVTNLGGVRQGNNLSISQNGTISITPGGTYEPLDNLSAQFDGLQTVFQLTINTVSFAPPTINALLIFLDSVIQVPNVSFTLSGSTITFAVAPQTGTLFYGISLT
jgi:hypothetical protein